MNLAEIAAQAGSTNVNLAKLISSGEGTPALARRLGTTSANLTAFVAGRASPAIARALGTTPANAQELRDAIGPKGAVGLIIGLACGRGGKKK